MTYWPFGKIPQISPDPALATALDNAAGGTGMASDAGHTHARRIQSMVLTLNASGEATFTFARVFTGKPAVACLCHEAADNQPIVFKVKSYVLNGANQYTGVIMKGYRAQNIPQNLVTLLLSGVFNLFGGTTLNGVEISVYAAEQTPP